VSDEREMNSQTRPHGLVSTLGDVARRRFENKSAVTQVQGVGLEARGIHAWFGDRMVIEDMSLDFWSGTVTALIGPSGC
jgi:phosphate transport system ATP-binding protein